MLKGNVPMNRHAHVVTLSSLWILCYRKVLFSSPLPTPHKLQVVSSCCCFI